MNHNELYNAVCKCFGLSGHLQVFMNRNYITSSAACFGISDHPFLIVLWVETGMRCKTYYKKEQNIRYISRSFLLLVRVVE